MTRKLTCLYIHCTILNVLNTGTTIHHGDAVTPSSKLNSAFSLDDRHNE